MKQDSHITEQIKSHKCVCLKTPSQLVILAFMVYLCSNFHQNHLRPCIKCLRVTVLWPWILRLWAASKEPGRKCACQFFFTPSLQPGNSKEKMPAYHGKLSALHFRSKMSHDNTNDLGECGQNLQTLCHRREKACPTLSTFWWTWNKSKTISPLAWWLVI